jgi:hypothetical protein
LSEAGSNSNRFVGKWRKAVRSRGTFGQVCRKNQKSCPKQGHLWTGLQEKPEKLSKAGAPLDRFAGKTRKAVRSRGTFGQVCRKNQKSCPKQWPLRTGLKENGEKLSEAGLALDRFEGKGQKAVRSRCSFGQVCKKKQKSCPKQWRLQTGLKKNAEKLSEARATSDRFERKSRKAVRNSGDFGQV